ncbi:LacI family DNA-binding transcriptional regulator [Roseovarius sp. C7]|uniref:LacI family DNA-binding transcriptional regulator n=1 Tax=Roseovarius sp. C7 TaxID=3398643 RepID=UPI0039F6C49D
MTEPVGKIRDVAKATGLSIATISRVMNGGKNVSPRTRDKVLEACKRLNYLPNPAARALSTSRSKTVAAIIPTIEHLIFAKYIASIEHSLAQRGYSLVIAISHGDLDEEYAAAQKLMGMGAEAFILSGAHHHPDLLALFARRGVPHVFSSIWDPAAAAPAIGYDNTALARAAMTFLAEHGHQHIAVLHGPLAESDRTRDRYAGAQAARADGLRVEFHETSLDVTGGKSATRALLEAPDRPSAIFCFSDVLALGTFFALSEAGLRCPDDVSLMGFDNLDWSRETAPPLTTIDLPATQMGAEVGTQLMDHLDTGAPLAPMRLEGAIVARASVARRD